MKGKKGALPAALLLLLLLVFGLCAILTVLIGARAYERVVDRSRESFRCHTALAYVAGKLRAQDTRGNVALDGFGGVTALTLSETIDGRVYLTRIYSLDGDLLELYCAAGLELYPEDGDTVLEDCAVTLAQTEDGGIGVSCGGTSLLLYPRAGETLP